MKIILTIFALALFGTGNAQVLERSVISSAGEHYVSAAGQLSFTLGEVVTATVADGTNELTQGFQQSGIVITSVEERAPELDLTLFPNPTISSITLRLKALEKGLKITMHTTEGKLLLEKTVRDLETQLNLSWLANGTYFINVLKDENRMKTFKVLKQ